MHFRDCRNIIDYEKKTKVLIGNKKDLEKMSRKVCSEEADVMVKTNGMLAFFETSAMESENIDEVSDIVVTNKCQDEPSLMFSLWNRATELSESDKKWFTINIQHNQQCFINLMCKELRYNVHVMFTISEDALTGSSRILCLVNKCKSVD